MDYQESSKLEIDGEILQIKSMIYFLIHNDVVVYVGQTRKGLSRPFAHDNKEYNKICILPCKEKDLDDREEYFIRKYEPKYNLYVFSKRYISLKTARDNIREQTGIHDYSSWNLRRMFATNSDRFSVIAGKTYVEKLYIEEIIKEMKND
jgi:hypothetical protein